MTSTDPAGLIGALFASAGAAEYLGEPVTQAAHMLQTATLAERESADPALIAAALLHDVGHLTKHSESKHGDDKHSDSGAIWLAQWFGPEVTEAVRLHVAAKRYLCAVDPGYASMLSAASVYTLSVQGGPMSAQEARRFAAHPHASAACRLRRWDDLAKDPEATTAPFDHFAPLLSELVRLTGR